MWRRWFRQATVGQRRPPYATVCHRRSTQVPPHATACHRKSTQVNTGQRKSTQVNAGQRRSTQVNTGQRRSTQVNAGQHRSTQVNTGQRRSTQVNTGQRKSTQVNASQHRSRASCQKETAALEAAALQSSEPQSGIRHRRPGSGTDTVRGVGTRRWPSKRWEGRAGE